MRNKNIVIAYLVVTLIFLVEIGLSLNGYSFSGYYVDKFINWIWLAMTLFIIIWFWKKKAIKVYFSLIVLVIVISILPMMIPFFALVYYFSTVDDFQQIELNESYRMERSRPAALYKPQIDLYRNEGIIEKRIYTTPYFKIVEKVLQKSTLDYEDGQQPIQNAKIINVTKDSIGIEYQIKNKKQVFYHKKGDKDL